MPVVWTSYGAPAYEALGLAVAEAKDGDPLAPVSVLVPANLCGVVARRVLARGVAGRGGVAGLSVLTVDRLAERIAAPALTGAGRRPATSAVLAAAWRRALAEDAGVFAPVAAHPVTVQALADRHRELREVDDAALDAIAGSGPVASDLVRLHRAVAGLLAARWYDPVDLRRTAAGLLRGGLRLGGEIGAVVLFLPQELPLSATAMLGELAGAGIRVIAGLTGDARADAGVLETLRRIGADGDGDAAAAPATAWRPASCMRPTPMMRSGAWSGWSRGSWPGSGPNGSPCCTAPLSRMPGCWLSIWMRQGSPRTAPRCGR